MKWTQTDRITLTNFVKLGWSDATLAMHFGVSEPAIRRARQRFAPESVVSRKLAAVDAANPGPNRATCSATPLATVNDQTIWVGPDSLPRQWNGKEWAVCTSPGPIGTVGDIGPIGCEGTPGPAETSGYVDAEVVGDPLIEQAKTVPAEFGSIPLEVFDGDAWTKIGLVADTHLCCREERLDALNAQYDLFAREGVRDVFHGGNIVDGYVPRINGGSVFETSVDGQALYCARHYPQRPGITTHFITGNDHEGWWQKEGFNFGAYLQMVCERLGRQDMKYLGHVEADIVLTAGEFKQIMKIQHPGGGSAYARSYKGQKIVEAFQGGEKPAILAIGHYHVSSYSFDRNVHIIGMPGFQDQTIFGRTKHLRYEIGGVILELKMSSKTGAITRVRPEFNMFFDRGFYKKFLPSDAELRGEPTVIKTGE